MKIALFTETYLPDINGVAAHLYTLKTGLEELGHQVLIVAADKNARRHYLKDGVLHCPSLESKKFYGFGVATPYSYRRMKYIREFAPDLIHIHHEFGIGLSGIYAARQLKLPLVYTLHTMYDEYVHYIAPESLTTLALKFSHRYERFVANQATILASPSRKGEEYFKIVGAKEKEFHLIPNSADLVAFHPGRLSEDEKYHLRGELKILPNSTIVCFVGRLGEEKSVDVLLNYWEEEISSSDKLHLMIIGGGPDKELLEQQAKNLGISSMVTFTGRIEHDKVPDYFAVSDAYITASLSEMNSISMLEGMATGLPCLQRFDELNAEQIEVGVNGWHYRNAKEMGDQLKEIASLSLNEKWELKKRVRLSVSKRDSKGLAEYLLNVYDRAITLKKQSVSL